MPVIKFEPSGVAVEVMDGSELLDAAKKAGVEINAPCGGKGVCGKCKVRIASGDVNAENLEVLSADDVDAGYVLACKSKISDSDLVVEIPDAESRAGGKFTDTSADAKLVRQELLPRKWQYDPLAVKWLLEVEQPQLDDGLSDLDRLTRAIQKDWGKKDVLYDLALIRKVADMLRSDGGKVTVTMVREPDKYHVIGIESGDTTTRGYGIAVDIGTTTVAVQLVRLSQAKVVATMTDYNDQIACGLDVISRINYAKTAERLAELRDKVLATINRLIEKLASENSIRPEDICDAVISANTTMVHLLLGLNPEYIRLAPYTPTVLKVPYLAACDVGININSSSWIYITPSAGSYVGGDITSGLLCTDVTTDTEDVSLFIDIGTNGELVIGNGEFLMTCACSAGPAFEGGGIEYGMRASTGAIEKVEINRQTGIAEFQTIGGGKAKGICGSGMISLLAELFLNGWLDAGGKLNREKSSDAIIADGRVAKYVIATADKSDSGKAIMISELDIENIIRAKAAIYSACAMMLEQLDMGFEDLAKVYIAGGFGRFLDLENARVIGLIPDLPLEKFQYIGNASLMGSYMVLISNEFHQKQIELANRMTYVDLSSDSSYMDQYTAALFLPHTDTSVFPTVAQKLKENTRG